MKKLPLFVILVLLSVASFFYVSSKAQALVGPTALGFSIRADGTIMKNDESIYLMGFYHDSDYQIRYGSDMANDFTVMCNAGFNLIQPVITGPNGISSTQQARDVAKNCKNGPMYIIASYYPPTYQTTVNTIKNDPTSTVMAYNTNDDFNYAYSNPDTSPAEAKIEADVINNYANSIGYKTWTYGSGGGYPYGRTVGGFAYRTTTQVPYLFGDYKDVNDFFGVQTYPISNTDGSFSGAPLEENYAYLQYSKSQLPDNKPLLANIQAFSWGPVGSGKRYPNAVETRNMVWAAIVTRVDGILAYSYWHDNGDLSKQTETWNEWVALRKDINDHKDPVTGQVTRRFLKAILDGKHTQMNTTIDGKGRVRAATYEYTDPTNGKSYVYAIAINTSSATPTPTTTPTTPNNLIKLPASVANMTMSPLFPGDKRYGNTLTLNNSGGTYYLSGTVAPSGVQVYVFESTGGLPGTTQQPSATPTQACLSDFNSDKVVDLLDYGLLVNSFLKAPIPVPQTDINKSGLTDLVDYSIVVKNFLRTCP